MLIEFTVENFRSIKEEVTLSMVATKDTSFDNHLIKTNVLKDDSLLKSAVIYGANASGKTNVILALSFLKALVLNSIKHQKGQGVRYTPFKLDDKCLKKPTRFNIVFIKNEIKYSYSVAFNNEKIVSESLYYYPNNQKSLLFERKNTNNFRFTIDKTNQKFIAKRTLENMLFLSKSAYENYEMTAPVFDWFRETLQFVKAYEPIISEEFTINILNSDIKLKELVLKALLEADFGIENVNAAVKKSDDFPVGIPSELKSLITNGKSILKQNEIKTYHKGIAFDYYAEESEGTKRMFSLIGPWIDALQNGRVLVVDELDTKLHHLLNLFLIKLFHNPTQNKNNAQLIFTTHNTNLLDIQDIFRRDQIWFTEKKDTGDTDLYSLVEYSPRTDKNIERGYLAGKYGALPFIKESRLF